MNNYISVVNIYIYILGVYIFAICSVVHTYGTAYAPTGAAKTAPKT